jgi:glycosyltransferase involved in cell wall biosynthesis
MSFFMPSDIPNIEILMPVRNGSKYIEQAIKSVLSDDIHILRLIVVDDGSTDDTKDIISKIDTRTEIRVISQGSLGLTSALNRGLEETNAEFIARMDADDISLKGRLPAQLAFLQQHPNVAAVGTQAAYIDEDGRELGTRTRYPLDPKEIRRQLFDKGCVICHPTILARRESLLRCGGYHGAFKHAEDYDLWLRLTDHYEIANLPDVFLRYRRHSQQVSNGRNIQQSFSRDFALWCARERQAQRPDPSRAITLPPKFRHLGKLSSDGSDTLANLALGYDAIEKIREGRSAYVSNRAILAISDLVQNGYLGETRRARYKLLVWSAKMALGRRRYLDAASTIAVLIACRITDCRLFRAVRQPGRVFPSPKLT